MDEALTLSSAAYEHEAAKRRAAFLAKVPDEPAAGGYDAAKICVHFGDKVKVWRRFDCDCTLEDLLNFARSLPGVPVGAVPRLTNVTMSPEVELDTSAQLGLTLERLDLWPTAHVRVRGSPAE